jgi:CAAX protease family protein
MDSSSRSWKIAATTIAGLLVANYAHEIVSGLPGYDWLHSHHPFYLAESIDKLFGTAVCVLAIWALYRMGPRGICSELGLSAPPLPAIAFGFCASLPMLIGFAFTRSFTRNIQVFPVLFLTVLSPLVEEIEFRGFGAWQPLRGTKWPFWIAVWPSAVLFGYGHVEQGQGFPQILGLFFLTGSGAVIFSWLVYRWQNLWVAVALHIFMNLWWELFSVARSAIGGWFPFVLQTAAMLFAILLTWYWTRPRPRAAGS